GVSESRGMAEGAESRQAGARGVARKSPCCRRFEHASHNLVVLTVLCYAAAAITDSGVYSEAWDGFRNRTCAKQHPTDLELADETHTAPHAFYIQILHRHSGFRLAQSGSDGDRAGSRFVRKFSRQPLQTRRALEPAAPGSPSAGPGRAHGASRSGRPLCPSRPHGECAASNDRYDRAASVS